MLAHILLSRRKCNEWVVRKERSSHGFFIKYKIVDCHMALAIISLCRMTMKTLNGEEEGGRKRIIYDMATNSLKMLLWAFPRLMNEFHLRLSFVIIRKNFSLCSIYFIWLSHLTRKIWNIAVIGNLSATTLIVQLFLSLSLNHYKLSIHSFSSLYLSAANFWFSIDEIFFDFFCALPQTHSYRMNGTVRHRREG